MEVWDDNVVVEGRGTGTRRVNPTTDSRGVRTTIQNHVAWFVNGIISDMREQRIRCCPGSLPRDLPSSSILSLATASLHLVWEWCRVVSVVALCGNHSLSLSLSFSLRFSWQFAEVVVMNNQLLDASRSREVNYWERPTTTVETAILSFYERVNISNCNLFSNLFPSFMRNISCFHYY